MTTFTNQSKNSITPTSSNKGGYALWDDAVVTWDDIGFAWDAPYNPITNISKNAITPTNITKN